MSTREHLFRRLPAYLGSLDVDSGQLSVAIMPLASLTAKGETIEWVLSCCHVFPVYAGESVGVERNSDTPARIAVTPGSDLCVPEDAQGAWVLVMGDPCYYLAGEYGTDADYGRACAASLSEDRHGFIVLNNGGRAFVSGTVYGDGSYPVRSHDGSFDMLLEGEPEDEESGWEDDLWDDEAEDELFDGDEDDADLDPDEREFLSESAASGDEDDE